MKNTYEEWKRISNLPGAQTTVENLSWLLKGCPKCDGVEWEITNDGWCYCCKCDKGYSTWGIGGIGMGPNILFYDKHGFHCFMCRGTGIYNEETCADCYGKVTQPQEED